jgi:protein-disulfide isomerase
MFLTLVNEVMHRIKHDETKKEGIAIKFHHVVQPWHPQSTMVHEAALAMKKATGDMVYLMYVEWIVRQFKENRKFSDADTWNKSRKEIYEDLLGPGSHYGSEAALKLCMPPEDGLEGNCGNGVTQDIKWACKHHRAMGVHVTPTVFVNGIEAVQVSSGWSGDDWMAFFDTFDL